MLTAFNKASEIEKVDTCKYAQLLLSNLSEEDVKKINIKTVLQPDSPANCEHSHTKYEVNDDKSKIDLTISSYPFYDDDKLKYL